MGAEGKGPPLSLDLVKCMKRASEAEYCLEITGLQSLDETSEENAEIYSTESVKADIQKYEGLWKTLGNNIRDKGEKLEIKLKKLYKTLAELQQRQAICTSLLVKEADQAPPKDNGHEIINKRISGKSSVILSCGNDQVTIHPGHKQGKGPTFNDAFLDFRDFPSSKNTKLGTSIWSNDGSTFQGQKDKSLLSVSTSSFYTSCQKFSRDSTMDCEDGKFQIRIKHSIAFNAASGKRQKTLSPLQNDNGTFFKSFSPSFAKQLEIVTDNELLLQSLSCQKSRFLPEIHTQKGCLGSSLDTAMELSDDEEKKDSENLKADCKCEDFVNQTYSSRSSITCWKRDFKVTYPRDDPEAVEVQQTDLKHVDPYEFLNDTVIDFYIKYLQRPAFLSQEKKAGFHFFNTFFYKKLLLEKRKKRKGSAYQLMVRKWTKGIIVFKKNYLLIPVHDCAHWSLAIVCFAKNCRERTLAPYILHLDSMREGHASEEVFAILRRYLEAEWNHIRGLDEFSKTSLTDFVCKRVEVPLQQNAWDCGLFLLYFIESFLQDADDVFEPHLLDSMFGRRWFKPQEASNLRKRIREILENLVQEFNDEIVMEDMD